MAPLVEPRRPWTPAARLTFRFLFYAQNQKPVPPDVPLMTRGFHWVTEAPFNR
jgi:hypothetical protein